MNIDLKRLHKNAFIPEVATLGSAAVDLRACLDSRVFLYPGESFLIPTGIAIHIADNNVAGLIIPRSGLGAKQGIVLGNGTGLIDSDYQGEIFVSLWNRGLNPFKVESGDRIAQLFFVPVITPTFKIVNDFESITDRADGGFGSTGTE